MGKELEKEADRQRTILRMSSTASGAGVRCMDDAVTRIAPNGKKDEYKDSLEIH